MVVYLNVFVSFTKYSKLNIYTCTFCIDYTTITMTFFFTIFLICTRSKCLILIEHFYTVQIYFGQYVLIILLIPIIYGKLEFSQTRFWIIMIHSRFQNKKYFDTIYPSDKSKNGHIFNT